MGDAAKGSVGVHGIVMRRLLMRRGGVGSSVVQEKVVCATGKLLELEDRRNGEWYRCDIDTEGVLGIVVHRDVLRQAADAGTSVMQVKVVCVANESSGKG